MKRRSRYGPKNKPPSTRREQIETAVIAVIMLVIIVLIAMQLGTGK